MFKFTTKSLDKCQIALHSTINCFYGVFGCVSHAVNNKINYLVSLPTLSNQDRELHKEAVLEEG